mmetsp:Transcript_24920/g.63463  ORF Transcript_24920/g.63463 Transcript_24920/m.63463 type:complete len:422 (-) Transcript_24920:541-1806(-)
MQSPTSNADLIPGTIVTAPTPEPVLLDDVFEGPEKKLEVFFSRSADGDGFRSFGEPIWQDVLTAARCTILHVQPSSAFDAYLLSESSLFVYPSRLILKTCGTTTLLLVLPKLLELAATLGVSLEHVHYSHYRYRFPTLQVYPHTSFDVEQRCLASLLDGHIAAVHARVLGNADGTCWYALCTEAPAEAVQEPPRKKPAAASSLPDEVDDLFEVAMEGLPADVCDVFYESHRVHQGATGKALATSMTKSSGIGAMLPGVAIDDWAFEPCGYSMNGSRGAYYYTIHITPELDFSYASFETNDPAYRAPERLAAVVSTFQPASLTVTLTTRRARCELPTYNLDGFERMLHDNHHLTPQVSVCCVSFEAAATAAAAAAAAAVPQAVASGAAPAEKSKRAIENDATGSEASSEDTCELAPSETVIA